MSEYTGRPVRRVALVVGRMLEPAAVANATAILMGQLALREPELYGPDEVLDADGVRHAGIGVDTVVLTGRPGHITRLITAAVEADLTYAVFTAAGRGLSNSFDAYRELVARSGTASLDVIGVGVVGPDPTVRALTRSFSSYRGGPG